MSVVEALLFAAWGGFLGITFLASVRRAARAALHSRRLAFLRLRAVSVALGAVLFPVGVGASRAAIISVMAGFVVVRAYALRREVSNLAS